MKRTNKIIAVLAILVAGSMIVGAALVPYLSNEVTTTATVSSPMEQWISESCWSGYVQDDSITFPDVLGGETVTFYVKTINNADAEIIGNCKNIVTSTGITCADFTSVKARTYSNGAWTPLYDITSTCALVSGHPNQRQFSYGPTPCIHWAPGQIDITEVVITFEDNVVGAYTMTSQIVPYIS